MNGNLINFEITGAELHNSPAAAERIERIAEADCWLAGKEYDFGEICEYARKNPQTHHFSIFQSSSLSSSIR